MITEEEKARKITYNSSSPESSIQFIDLKAQRQVIETQVSLAVNRVLQHGQYILGPEVYELEDRLKSYTGAKHAITCANGTDALKLLLLAKNTKPGDIVFVPSFTFASTAEVVAEIGAVPYFVDVDPITFNIDASSLELAIQEASKSGQNPKGIIAVDLFGLPADYKSLEIIAKKHHLWIMADAAQSFGGSIGSQRVGQLAEITATSFFPSKPLGCYGDGGCIFTENDEVAETVRSLRAHGVGQHRYHHVRIGLNSRLDTLQAAILLEKLNVFDEEYQNRCELAQFYQTHLSKYVKVPQYPEGAQSAHALYTIRVPSENRDKINACLNDAKIPTAVYYKTPLHQQPAYEHFPSAQLQLPVTEVLSQEVISIPMHPYLKQEAREFIVATLQALTT